MVMAGVATSGQQVADKAECVVDDVKETKYQHKSHIVVATGTYDVDCNGFVGYVLEHAAPEHYREIPKEADQIRPRAFKYYDYFAALPDDGAGGWLRVDRLADACRGDVIAWRLVEHPELHHDTGHVMIIAEDPGDDGDGVLSVRIYDSSDAPHFDDSRGQGGDSPATGVGTGTVRFRVDADGRPIEFQFGPPPEHFRSHPIAIGRLEPLTPWLS
jgi:hypothetical protein